MPGLDTDLAGRFTPRDRSLVHTPQPTGRELKLPRRISDEFVLSLSPTDLSSLSRPDFNRIAKVFGRVEGRLYRRENWSRGGSDFSQSGGEKTPLPNE